MSNRNNACRRLNPASFEYDASAYVEDSMLALLVMSTRSSLANATEMRARFDALDGDLRHDCSPLEI